MGAGLGLTALPRNAVTEEVKTGKLRLVGVQGLSLPVVLKVVTHREKRESKAFRQFLALASKELGRLGHWQNSPT